MGSGWEGGQKTPTSLPACEARLLLMVQSARSIWRRQSAVSAQIYGRDSVGGKVPAAHTSWFPSLFSLLLLFPLLAACEGRRRVAKLLVTQISSVH